jgi:two-component system, NtrC family, nitrogen regulation response regulator NtrX
MSLSAQSKVLRALQENLINRVGSDRDIKVDVRVLAATNKDLKKEIEAGRFREDLYHRLSVILVQVPALKERIEDIPLLVDKFLDDIAQESGDVKKGITKEALSKLKEFPWTGNIRELRNVVERLVILGEPVISLDDIKKYADY